MYDVVVPYDEIKLKRQARRTELQRERRERERIEIKKLKEFAEQLEKERRQWSRKNTTDQPLSWEDIATSLKEATQDAHDENAKLKEEQRKLVQVIAGMTKWIACAKGIMRGPHTLPYTASHLNLYHVTLNAANTICRQHGLDWLTQILYHNTEALLRRYEFWPEISTDVQCSYHTDMSNPDDIQCVWRFQVDVPKAMEGVVDAVRQKVANRLNNTDMWDLSSSPIDQELVGRISPTMTYVRRHPQSSTQNGSNILYREFQDGTDRTVFVGQNIYDDKFESPARRSKSMTWVQVTRLAPSWTRVSILSVSSLVYTSDGFCPLTEQAKIFGLKLDPHVVNHETSFARELQPITRFTTVAWLGYLNDAVRMAHTKKTKSNGFSASASPSRFEEEN